MVSSFHTKQMSAVNEIKERVFVWDAIRRWYKVEVPDRCGLYPCPWRDDANPSFSIFAGGTMWKDQASGESSDVIGLLTRDGKTFPQAISILSEWIGLKQIHYERREKAKRELAALPPTPVEYNKLAKLCRKDVSGWQDRPNVLKSLCARKRWDEKLMEALIQRGCVGLHGDKVAWIFQRGIKTRGSAFVSREDRWLCGKSNSSVYLDLIFNAKSSVVFLCEGESDSISVLFSGACKGGKCSVLGVAGGTVKPHPDLLKPMLYGKLVVLIGDNDKAGRGFIKRMTQHLLLMGIMAKHLNWSGLSYNDVSDFYASEGAGAVRDWVLNSSQWTAWNPPSNAE